MNSPSLTGGAAINITKALKFIHRPDIKFNMKLLEEAWVGIIIDPCNGKVHILIGYQLYILGDKFLKYNSHKETEGYLDNYAPLY